MSEPFVISMVAFISFVGACSIQCVGPSYANSLKMEVARIYSAKQIGSERVEVEIMSTTTEIPKQDWM